MRIRLLCRQLSCWAPRHSHSRKLIPKLNSPQALPQKTAGIMRPLCARGSLLRIRASSEAQNNMGHMYEEGLGVAQNYTTAMQWYRKAADGGLAEAQQNVGLLYYYGYGVAENAREAVRWFQMAADQSLAAGEYMLALASQQGKGTSLDYAKARRLFLSSARKNYGDAQLMYAYMLQAGEGADSMPMSAYVWGKIAEANGVEAAIDVTSLSSILLSDKEMARAESTIAQCLAEGLDNCPE